jgi:hypothetical protein
MLNVHHNMIRYEMTTGITTHIYVCLVPSLLLLPFERQFFYSIPRNAHKLNSYEINYITFIKGAEEDTVQDTHYRMFYMKFH